MHFKCVYIKIWLSGEWNSKFQKESKSGILCLKRQRKAAGAWPLTPSLGALKLNIYKSRKICVAFFWGGVHTTKQY